MKTLYFNARVYTRDFRFEKGYFTVENGRFAEVAHGEPGETGGDVEKIDLHGATVVPGLVDVHNHGNSNADFSDGSIEGLRKMAAYLGRSGVTSFAPASMTLPYETIAAALDTAVTLRAENPANSSRIAGVQMEGPFFSEKKKGAQNGAYLRNPDFKAFKKLHEGSKGLLRIVDVAPELPGAIDFVRKASGLCTVSIAHTDATYDDARAAIDAGATHVTHLYNAMPGIHHRKPGVIAAAAESPAVRAELICDGIHVHPASIRLAFRLFGGERMVLISDALRCCGMPDGQYELGGQDVFLKGKTCTLADGTLAGSVTNLFDCMRNAIAFGIPAEDAVRAAAYNPACALNRVDEIGSIAPGKFADFVVCDAAFAPAEVFIGGKKV